MAFCARYAQSDHEAVEQGLPHIYEAVDDELRTRIDDTERTVGP